MNTNSGQEEQGQEQPFEDNFSDEDYEEEEDKESVEEAPKVRRNQQARQRRITRQSDETTTRSKENFAEQMLQQLMDLVANRKETLKEQGKRERSSEMEEDQDRLEVKQRKVTWSSILRSVTRLPEDIDIARRLDEKPKNILASLSFLGVPCVGRGALKLMSGPERKEFEELAKSIKYSTGMSVLASMPLTPLKSLPLDEEYQDLQLYVRMLEAATTMYDDVLPPIYLYVVLGVVSLMVEKTKYLYHRDKDGKVAQVIYKTNEDYDSIESRSKAVAIMNSGRWNGGWSQQGNTAQRGQNRSNGTRTFNSNRQAMSRPNTYSGRAIQGRGGSYTPKSI